MVCATSVSSNLAAIGSTVVSPLHSSRSPSDVLPSSAESSASRGKKTLLFFFAQVIVELLLIQSGNAE